MTLYVLLELVAGVGELIFLFFIITAIADGIKAVIKNCKWTITMESFKKKLPGTFYLAFMMAPTIYLTEFSITKEDNNYVLFRLLYSIIALALCVYSSYQDIKEHK